LEAAEEQYVDRTAAVAELWMPKPVPAPLLLPQVRKPVLVLGQRAALA